MRSMVDPAGNRVERDWAMITSLGSGSPGSQGYWVLNQVAIRRSACELAPIAPGRKWLLAGSDEFQEHRA